MLFRFGNRYIHGNQFEDLRTILRDADSILIGAGAGLSASAGFVYGGERFRECFSDFEGKYGFHDMYSGGFYPYRTAEEYWAYWSRYIYINRYMDAPNSVYSDLYGLVKDKDFFMLTTNVDHCFQKAGFDKKRLFYTQGDYGLFQCSRPCCNETYDNEAIIESMVKGQSGMRIPSELIPYCPHCGSLMTVNLRSDGKFVEDEGWQEAADRYLKFITSHRKGKVLFLELGVGYNTPGIIKYPFWKMAIENHDSFYVSINKGEAAVPDALMDRSLCINDDIHHALLAINALDRKEMEAI